MVNSDKSSILTNKQRGWLEGTESVAHKYKLQERIQQRLRAAVATDSELLAEALEDGRLNADTVGNGLDFVELGDGISAFVAALYRIADESGLDAEKTIRKGIKKGEEGRIARLEQKLEEEGAKELTLGELMDLRDEKPAVAERLNLQLDIDLSDSNVGMYGTREDISEELTER